LDGETQAHARIVATDNERNFKGIDILNPMRQDR